MNQYHVHLSPIRLGLMTGKTMKFYAYISALFFTGAVYADGDKTVDLHTYLEPDYVKKTFENIDEFAVIMDSAMNDVVVNKNQDTKFISKYDVPESERIDVQKLNSILNASLVEDAGALASRMLWISGARLRYCGISQDKSKCDYTKIEWHLNYIHDALKYFQECKNTNCDANDNHLNSIVLSKALSMLKENLKSCKSMENQ